jgi:hypothetical protein
VPIVGDAAGQQDLARDHGRRAVRGDARPLEEARSAERDERVGQVLD